MNDDLGPLYSDVWLTLQTRHAQMAIRGRTVEGKPPISGLIAFADRLRLIWHAAQEDDPYADWWLIKIDDALEVASARISVVHDEIRSALSVATALRIAPASAKEPFRIRLQFSSPYAYRAANVISEFDSMVCDLLTSRHVGLVTPKQARNLLNSCTSRLRTLLSVPQRFKRLGLDRKTIQSFPDVTDRARTLMGELPDDVLNAERRAPLAPERLHLNAPSLPEAIVGIPDDIAANGTP